MLSEVSDDNFRLATDWPLLLNNPQCSGDCYYYLDPLFISINQRNSEMYKKNNKNCARERKQRALAAYMDVRLF